MRRLHQLVPFPFHTNKARSEERTRSDGKRRRTLNTPYFQDSKCTLYHGDCLEILPEVGTVDMVLCDPPYGTTNCDWDSVIPLEKMWDELKRIVKPKGAVVMTACQPFTSVLIMSNLQMFKYCWVWEKNKASGHLNSKKMPLRSHEDVVVFADGLPTYYPQMTEGHLPANYAKRIGMSECYGSQKTTEYGGATTRYPRSVQRFDIVDNISKERWHPTQKPVSLFEYLVQTYTEAGDVVLDFCFGSGTTAVACKNLGRKFIGVEREEKYCEIAASRLAQEVFDFAS